MSTHIPEAGTGRARRCRSSEGGVQKVDRKRARKNVIVRFVTVRTHKGCVSRASVALSLCEGRKQPTRAWVLEENVRKGIINGPGSRTPAVLGPLKGVAGHLDELGARERLLLALVLRVRRARRGQAGGGGRGAARVDVVVDCLEGHVLVT